MTPIATILNHAPRGAHGEHPQGQQASARGGRVSPPQTEIDMNLMGKEPIGQKCPPFVSHDLRKFARGKPCQMQSEFCNHDPETTVLCHSRRGAGAGMGQKPPDWWAYHGCSGCHANEDKVSFAEIYNAIRRTQNAVYQHFGTLTP